jgi:hypothetical protein
MLGAALNVNADQDGGESSIVTDGDRLAVAWMEKASATGIYQVFVKQWNSTAGAWEQLGGSLNIDSAHHVYEPLLAYHQGSVWAAWSECVDGSGIPESACTGSRVYARYWDGSQWVDPGGTPTPLNQDPARSGVAGFLRSDGTSLYLVWEEEGPFRVPQIYVQRWDAVSGWVTLGGSLNVDTLHIAVEPILEVVGGLPYAIWTEEDASGYRQVYVKHWDAQGGIWVQDGAGSLNTSLVQSGGDPALVNHGGVLYAVWHERVSVAESPVERLFVKHLSAGTWIRDADAGPGGTLNRDSTMNAAYPRLASAGSRLYAVWLEKTVSGQSQVYVKQLEAGSWISVPDVGVGGSLSLDSTHSAHEVAITAIGEAPVVSWDEDRGNGSVLVHV